jgi:hypothetical protein
MWIGAAVVTVTLTSVGIGAVVWSAGRADVPATADTRAAAAAPAAEAAEPAEASDDTGALDEDPPPPEAAAGATADPAATASALAAAGDQTKTKALAPSDPRVEKKPKALGEFNVAAAKAALGSAASAAAGCRGDTVQSGTGRADVTFAPSGKVTGVSLSGPLSIFRGATVPPFSGGPMTAQKKFTVK